MNLLTGLGRLEKAAFVFFCLFSLLQCLSNAAANIALGLAVFFSILHIISAVKEYIFPSFKKILCENKTLIILFLFFWLTMFLSALFSGDPAKGLKVFFGQIVYRSFPFFIILFVFPKSKYAALFLFLSLVSCTIDVIGGMIIHGGEPRMKGLYGHPMTLAGFLVIQLPILFCLLLDWKQKWSSFLGCICLFLISFAGLLFNGTRGAWLALAVAIPVLTLLYDRSIKKILFLAFFAASTALVFVNSSNLQTRAESITSTTLQSNTERILIWQSAYQMFKDHPFLGVGLGQYTPKYLNEYKSSQAKENVRHAHNNFMQMLAENGFFGFIGFVSLFGYILISSLRGALQRFSPYSVLVFSCTFALLLQGLTEYNFGNSAVIKYFWVILGCLMVLMRQNSSLNLILPLEPRVGRENSNS